MNQYRCETCSKDHYCPIVHAADCVEKCDCWIKDVTSIIGCASHSNFQNQREKVLDKVIQELNQAAPEIEGDKLFITVLALMRRIDKLRQSKEE